MQTLIRSTVVVFSTSTAFNQSVIQVTSWEPHNTPYCFRSILVSFALLVVFALYESPEVLVYIRIPDTLANSIRCVWNAKTRIRPSTDIMIKWRYWAKWIKPKNRAFLIWAWLLNEEYILHIFPLIFSRFIVMFLSRTSLLCSCVKTVNVFQPNVSDGSLTCVH